MTEIEVKIPVQDPEGLKKKLLALGAVLRRERFREENTLYDFDGQPLFHQREALRLRKEGQKAFLTFKGPCQKSRHFKIREEFETEVKNLKHTKKILRALGLRPSFSYGKYRTIFKKNRLKVCLDETPIGAFLELEGERSDIVRFAKALGFSRRDFIKKDYIQLLKEKADAT
ncbi:MAG: class IV adenylate cyclase [Candidatus Aminicenantales bacterium]